MPDNVIVALTMAVGIGIIDISIGIVALLLGKATTIKGKADVIAGWSASIVLGISALGALCFLVALGK